MHLVFHPTRRQGYFPKQIEPQLKLYGSSEIKTYKIRTN